VDQPIQVARVDQAVQLAREDQTLRVVRAKMTHGGTGSMVTSRDLLPPPPKNSWGQLWGYGHRKDTGSGTDTGSDVCAAHTHDMAVAIMASVVVTEGSDITKKSKMAAPVFLRFSMQFTCVCVLQA